MNFKNYNLKILLQNIRSAEKNLDPFLTHLYNDNIYPDLIFLTETWTKNEQNMSIYDKYGYDIFSFGSNLNKASTYNLQLIKLNPCILI